MVAIQIQFEAMRTTLIVGRLILKVTIPHVDMAGSMEEVSITIIIDFSVKSTKYYVIMQIDVGIVTIRIFLPLIAIMLSMPIRM